MHPIGPGILEGIEKLPLNEWITYLRSHGFWITKCMACGDWFAQLHKGRVGRRAEACTKKWCVLALRYRRHYGRFPPNWLVVKWREKHGDEPAQSKRYEYPRRAA